eukprot:scaffold54319_cov19-Tisochrysis_lutea.AAC.1
MAAPSPPHPSRHPSGRVTIPTANKTKVTLTAAVTTYCTTIYRATMWGSGQTLTHKIHARLQHTQPHSPTMPDWDALPPVCLYCPWRVVQCTLTLMLDLDTSTAQHMVLQQVYCLACCTYTCHTQTTMHPHQLIAVNAHTQVCAVLALFLFCRPPTRHLANWAPRKLTHPSCAEHQQ